jgi:hypothetical protein
LRAVFLALIFRTPARLTPARLVVLRPVVRFFPLVFVAMISAPVLFACRTRPFHRTRARTNHANWSNLAVPHGESIVFFHYTLIASENGNCRAILLNCFDNKFLLAKPPRTHSLRLSAFPLSARPDTR